MFIPAHQLLLESLTVATLKYNRLGIFPKKLLNFVFQNGIVNFCNDVCWFGFFRQCFSNGKSTTFKKFIKLLTFKHLTLLSFYISMTLLEIRCFNFNLFIYLFIFIVVTSHHRVCNAMMQRNMCNAIMQIYN